MILSRLFAGVLAFSILSGCTGMKIDDFKNSEPAFVLEEYFAGEVRAAGMFEARFGVVRRQFTVDIKGAWDGKVLILDERFHYSDGEKDRRVWTIEKTGDTSYVGRADDVIGLAQGEAQGNALNWRYDLKLKVGNGIWRVHFDDWMFLQDKGILINRAEVKKWGLNIGVETITFLKLD